MRALSLSRVVGRRLRTRALYVCALVQPGEEKARGPCSVLTGPPCAFPRPPASLFRNVEEIEKLSELGVLFLLFEMGLELTIDKLRVRSAAQRAPAGGKQRHPRWQAQPEGYRSDTSA